jgi:hypothetical protein
MLALIRSIIGCLILADATFLVVGGFAIATDGPPAVDPRQAIRITVEPPNRMVWLGGPLPLQVWFENCCDQDLLLCRPLDGSMDLGRNPEYKVQITDPKGRVLPRESGRWCGTMNALKEEDFFRLGPGEKIDMWGHFGIFEIAWATQYPDLRPGVPYTITVSYRMGGRGRVPLEERLLGPREFEADRLFRRAVRCEATSLPVTITFSPDPVTEADRRWQASLPKPNRGAEQPRRDGAAR